MFVDCGITNQVDAELIAAGADALGFNFTAAGVILSPRKRRLIRERPIRLFAVVVNPTESYATMITALDGIDLLQLHGAESPEFCLNLVEADILLWKAIAMTGPGTWLPDYHAERILLDTVAGRKFGGTGVPFPWRWARDLIMANPTLELILAGGLTPENVGRAITESRPFGVDVASGVEGQSGRKDIYRVRDFIAAARSA